MHCWFCESPLASDGPGAIYCSFAACPACKELAPPGAALDAAAPARWQAMKEAGTLRDNLLRAGLLDRSFDNP
jgi:hypothetical protein